MSQRSKEGTAKKKMSAVMIFTDPETDNFLGNFESQRTCPFNQVTSAASICSVFNLAFNVS